MARRPSYRRALLAATALVALAGCGTDDEGTAGERAQGGTEAHREGLALDLAGLQYNVFLTRQLNLALPEDRAYHDGEPERPGRALYGVFLQVCNPADADAALEAASDFRIVDSQGTEFEPTPLPANNAFAYPLPQEEGEELAGEVPVPAAANPRQVEPGACIPLTGSVAHLGPTAGAMLLFDLPRENTENRPLELEIEHGSDSLAFELDF